MNQKKTVLGAAVAAAFALAAGSASAVVNLSTGTTAVKFASEITTPAVLTNASNLLDVSLNSVSALNSITTPLVLRFDLTGGAVFTTDPSVYCSAATYTGGGLAGAVTATTVAGTKNVGGAGNSSVTFTVTTGAAHAAGTAIGTLSAVDVTNVLLTGQCYLTGFGGISASDQASKGISAVLSYTIGGTTTNDARAATTFVTFNKGVSASVSTPATAVLIDGATAGFKNFVSASNLTTTTALLGSVLYQGVGGIYTAGGADSALPATVATASTLTFSGAVFAGAVSAYITTAGDNCAGTRVSSMTAGLANTVTFTGIANTVMSAGIDVCVVVDGTKALSESQVSVVTFTAGANTGFTPNTTGGTGNIANVTNNGQTRNAWFVNAAASTNKTTVLRVINKSGLTGEIKGTLYAEDGSVLGTANTAIGSFTSTGQQMLTLTSADIESKFGVSLAATAKSSLKLFSPIGNIEVINLSKDVATGQLYLVNTGTTSTN